LTYYTGLGVLFKEFVGRDVLFSTDIVPSHVLVSLAHVVVIVAHVSESETRGVLFTLPVGFGVLFKAII
jgi:hypothetical protein